ncbi:hypothetical protein GCM10027589_04390 [Actinocorallia lasiicapitis]
MENSEDGVHEDAAVEAFERLRGELRQPEVSRAIQILALVTEHAVVREADGRPVSVETLRDGLMQVPGAHLDLDYFEGQLIALARSKRMTWQDIAEALGYERRTAAQLRYKRLRDRFGDGLIGGLAGDDATPEEGS